MSGTPRIAIIITSYNDAATIAETVASIGAQRGIERIMELALFDDASRDDSVATARAAWPADVPLLVIDTPANLGPWPNLNRALQYGATIADWIIVMHADDSVEPGWLDALITRIDACPEDVASMSSSWNMLHADGTRVPGEDSSTPYHRIEGSTEALTDTVMKGCWWKLSGAAIRGRAFQDIGDFDGVYAQCGDWEWLLRALAKGWAIEYIPRSYLNYRQHGATMSTRALRDDVEITDALRVLDRYAGSLSRGARFRFLAQRAGFLVRRFGRGVLNRDTQRMASALRTSTRVARSFGRHVL